MAVKRLAGRTWLERAAAAKYYGDLGVAGWAKFLKDVCEHPLPEWLTYSMGRTSKNGEMQWPMVS